jgi:hypothetical protein
MPDDPQPFDMVRASFYLVALVFALYGGMAFMSTAWCLYHDTCPKDGSLIDAMGSLLASSLAYAAGQGSKK